MRYIGLCVVVVASCYSYDMQYVLVCSMAVHRISVMLYILCQTQSLKMLLFRVTYSVHDVQVLSPLDSKSDGLVDMPENVNGLEMSDPHHQLFVNLHQLIPHLQHATLVSNEARLYVADANVWGVCVSASLHINPQRLVKCCVQL